MQRAGHSSAAPAGAPPPEPAGTGMSSVGAASCSVQSCHALHPEQRWIPQRPTRKSVALHPPLLGGFGLQVLLCLCSSPAVPPGTHLWQRHQCCHCCLQLRPHRLKSKALQGIAL